MGKIAEECNLDVDPGERARALHRVVRAMHDGHCPSCGHLAPSDIFYQAEITNPQHKDGPRPARHLCPSCSFYVTAEEAAAALAEFRPYLNKSADIFLSWRQSRSKILSTDTPVPFAQLTALTQKALTAVEEWIKSMGITKDTAQNYYIEEKPDQSGSRVYTLCSKSDRSPLVSMTLRY